MPELCLRLLLLLAAAGYSCEQTTNLAGGKALTQPIDSLVVFKSKRIMHAYASNSISKSYKISLGGNPVGHKQFQGDNKTPEGLYFINEKNPDSRFHKSLGISYPNEQDRVFAQAQGKSPGGDIMIHGLPNGLEEWEDYYASTDWTLGCIAVNNCEIDELFNFVGIGTPIRIKP